MLLALKRELLELLKGHGLGEIVALEESTAHVCQLGVLLLRLNALGQGGYVQLVREADDVLDYGRCLAVAVRGGQELHVYLQHVNRHILQKVQGGITAAEVVHLHDEACLAQVLEGLHPLVLIVHHHGLGDLDAQSGGLDAVLLHKGDELGGDVKEIEVLGRYVHGDEHIPVLLSPACQYPAGAAPHMPVHLGDHAVLLEDGDEHIGRHKALFGVYPAGQSLGAHNGAAAVGDGLQIGPQLHGLDGLPQGCGDGLVPEDLVPQLVVVEGYVGVVIVVYGGEGKVRPVKHYRNVDVLFSHLVYAHVYQQVVLPAAVGDREALKLPLDGLLVALEPVLRCQHAEGVPCQPAVDAALVHVPPYPVGYLAEGRVAEGRAENVVYYLEVLNVHEHRLVGGLGVVVHHPANAVVEVLLGVKAREAVVGGIVQLPLDALLLLGVVPDHNEGARKVLAVGAYAVGLDDVVSGVLAKAHGPCLHPVVPGKLPLAEDAPEGGGDLFKVFGVGVGQPQAGLVGPDAAARGVIDEQRIVQAGDHVGEHPVHKAHWPVVQGKIEHQQSKDAVAAHGKVNGRPRKDEEGLGQSDNDHQEEDDRIFFPIDAGALYAADGENGDDAEKDEIDHHAVNGLAKVGHNGVIVLALNVHGLQLEGVAKEGVQKHLHGVRRQYDIHHSGPLPAVAYALTVFVGKAHQRRHHKVHAKEIYIAAPNRASLYAGADDDKISHDRRHEGELKQAHRFSDELLRPEGQHRKDQKQQRQTGKYRRDSDADIKIQTAPPPAAQSLRLFLFSYILLSARSKTCLTFWCREES